MPQLIYSPWAKFCGKGNDPSAKEVCFTGKDARTEAGQPVVAAALIEPEGEPKKLFRVTLEVADGGEGIEDHVAVLLIGLLFFWGEDAELAGESVAIGIKAATALAFRSFGSRGTVGGRSWVGLLVGLAFPFPINIGKRSPAFPVMSPHRTYGSVYGGSAG